MNYYKMFQLTNFIGMINSNNFYKYNNHNNLFYLSEEAQAQCIELNGNFYRIAEMQPLPSNFTNYLLIRLFPATEDEYEEYKLMIENNLSIDITYPEPIEIPEELSPLPASLPLPESGQPKMTIQEMRDKITEQEQQIQLLTNYILELN